MSESEAGWATGWRLAFCPEADPWPAKRPVKSTIVETSNLRLLPICVIFLSRFVISILASTAAVRSQSWPCEESLIDEHRACQMARPSGPNKLIETKEDQTRGTGDCILTVNDSVPKIRRMPACWQSPLRLRLAI